MPSKLFRVNLYSVQSRNRSTNRPTSFRKAIRRAMDETLDDREKDAAGKWRRLDDAHKRSSDVYLLNFITLEYSGPGRVRRGQPTSDFAMRSDEFFTPETAALYDHQQRVVLMESTQGGMGTGAVAHYFEQFADKGTEYRLIPVVDTEIAAKARRFGSYRKLYMRVKMLPMSLSNDAADVDLVEAFGEGLGAETIDIELKAGRRKRNTLDVWKLRESLDAMLSRDSIEKLEITGREDDDAQTETIDMIQHRERRQEYLNIDSGTRRVSSGTRWESLIGMHYDFLADLRRRQDQDEEN